MVEDTNELRALIRSGRLATHTQLVHVGRKRKSPRRDAEALITDNGIKVGESTYDSPSGAARAIAGRPVNGWTYWKVKNTGKWLDEYRLSPRATT